MKIYTMGRKKIIQWGWAIMRSL